jgi:hypothetical protein
MELAGRNLVASLCPTQNYLPYFKVQIGEWVASGPLDYTHQSDPLKNLVSIEIEMPSHNLGRWWDAMLRLEDAIGFPIPLREETAMLANLLRHTDNEEGFCLDPADLRIGNPTFELHSLRETLLAWNALARFRHSRDAVRQGRRLLEGVRRIARPSGELDVDNLTPGGFASAASEIAENAAKPTVSIDGRFIEALVWFHETTGDDLALSLADRFARLHLEKTTKLDGTINHDLNPRHTHSYLGTLRGLLLFGLMTNQRDYIDAVAETYSKTVRTEIVRPSGWTSHNLLQDNQPETASPGDAAQMALWLAVRDGRVELLDDVERIVRARILPSQIVESPTFDRALRINRDNPEITVPDEMEYDDIGERVVGAIGGTHLEAHGGKRSVTDVTAAALHTLVDVYNNIYRRDSNGLTVFMHFDTEDEKVAIRSKRRDGEAEVSIHSKAQGRVRVRIPRWTPRESVNFELDGERIEPQFVGDFACLPDHGRPNRIVLRYGLPEKETFEVSQGVEYRFHWCGDEIVGVKPNASFLPFYPTWVDS